jgi:hypothetical protein
MLFYRAALPLSCKTLNYAAGIIRRHRKSIGSRWRKLNPGQQALLVLAHLRKGETFADLAAGFAVGVTTAWRYVQEVVALLAARAPKLREAVRDAKRAGWAYVVLDGTLIPIDRVAADRPFYSGKHQKHGMNLWPSRPCPASRARRDATSEGASGSSSRPGVAPWSAWMATKAPSMAASAKHASWSVAGFRGSSPNAVAIRSSPGRSARRSHRQSDTAVPTVPGGHR